VVDSESEGAELFGTDPKDGDLGLCRVKPGEILVEARRRSDVQIDVQTWGKGRKTHRTV